MGGVGVIPRMTREELLAARMPKCLITQDSRVKHSMPKNGESTGSN